MGACRAYFAAEPPSSLLKAHLVLSHLLTIVPVVSAPPINPIGPNILADDEEGWRGMAVIRDDDDFAGLDKEDQNKYHYIAPAKTVFNSGAEQNDAAGALFDVDYEENEWRTNADQNENEYTRVRVDEEGESDEIYPRTWYLFDEDKDMTPLGHMQQTSDIFTEAQRIAYVGLCQFTAKDLVDKMRGVNEGVQEGYTKHGAMELVTKGEASILKHLCQGRHDAEQARESRR